MNQVNDNLAIGLRTIVYIFHTGIIS